MHSGRRRPAREDLPLEGGPGMIVLCAAGGCPRAALLDPRRFGAKRDWPPAGPSSRFRCSCGCRRAIVSFTSRPVDRYGPIDRASLALWY